MSDSIKVQGMVLKATPVGEHDKRLVIQTTALGRITAFARGARRPNSPLVASANPFVMGEFTLYEGKNAYNCAEVNASGYFRELSGLIPGVYMGFYFLDLVDYFGRENIDGTDMLNLLYVCLKMLIRDDVPDMFVRCVFELRLLYQAGVYAPDPGRMEEGLYALCDRICRLPLRKLFTELPEEDMVEKLDAYAEKVTKNTLDRPLKSAEIMRDYYR